jgi:uncharacterized protein (TIGR03083 family)
MSSDPQVERCLISLRELSSALSNELRTMSPEAWDGPTNCAPWQVKDLVSHIIVSGEGFAASIRQGLAGSVEQSISHHDRDRRQEQLAADGPANAARELDALTDAFIGLYDGLDEAGLSAICFHRRGNRSVRWYAAHRLAEVAFHSWDLQVSLEREPTLSEEVASLLLPTLLESNAPRTYAAGLSDQRGTGERYLLAVGDDPAARWLITIDPDQLTAVRGDAPADVTITGSAAALALLVYGRVGVSQLFQSGAIHLDGDLVLADRFASVYPRP